MMPLCTHIEEGRACCSEARPLRDRNGRQQTYRVKGRELPLWECVDAGHLFTLPEVPDHRAAGE